MIGHVFLRVVVPFRGWPWYLARLVNDSTVAFDKNQIADRFWKSSSCCLDDSFSLKFRATLASAADITSARSLLILKNVFSNVPVNNVKCETQFGRQRNAASAGRGQAPDCSTLASKHVLSEMIHLYRKRALGKQARLAAIVPLADARIVRKHNLKRKVCGWNMFVHKNRARLASGLSMSALSAEFRGLCDEQKAALDIEACRDISEPAWEPPSLALCCEETPLGIGDTCFPVSMNAIQEVVQMLQMC